MLKKIILMALISSGAFAAHQIEANVNDKEVEGQIRLDIGRMGNAMSNTYIGARFLNGDNNNSQTINNPDPLMEVSFMVMRPVQGVSGLRLGLGIKAEYTTIDGRRYVAIPLGAEAELQLPINTPFPVYLGGALYYAPSALSFKEGDGYLETRIHLDVEPIENGRLEVGYRKIDTDLKNVDVTYNDSWYFGMRLDF
ncbi:YfaZ family outer membrane protein [Sulfuricurvum sp.]|uniref:YfaZ family outer membrane protein n=1 Tax=Sulfuricurvum sp. TaxID=2025608 RepID=UPI003BB70642